jgi:formiminotetrahydrofolate cyclodeaminase
LDLADADAEAVDEYLVSENESSQASLERATGVRLTIAKACVRVLNQGALVAEKGNTNAFADVFTGLLFTRAAF